MGLLLQSFSGETDRIREQDRADRVELSAIEIASENQSRSQA
jgi:hypothetical protein